MDNTYRDDKETSVVTMDSIRTNKAELIEKLKANRQLHKIAFDEALEAYKVIVENKLKERMVEIEELLRKVNGNEEFDIDTYRYRLDVSKPSHHLEEYDTAIGMLEYSIDTVVKLSRSEFQCYVMDNWTWKREYMTTNNALITGSVMYKNSK